MPRALERLEDRRLLSAGDLDMTFGNGGLAIANFTTGSDQVNAIAIQPDGKIITGGQADGQNSFAAARFNSDGTLDASFAGGGKVTTFFPSSTGAAASGIDLQPDGKIMLGGFTSRTVTVKKTTTTYYDFAVARYTSAGTLDTTFDTDGMVTTSFGNEKRAIASAVVVQPDGKILEGGGAWPSTSSLYNIALVRYTSGGSLDSSFGTGGKVQTVLPGFAYSAVEDVALQADGKIVVVGTASVDGSAAAYRLLVTRYNTNGTLDTSFSDDGFVVLNTTGRTGRAVVIQPDGKIVAAATTTSVAGTFALTRFNPDGSLDTTFGTGGDVTTFVVSGNSVLNDVMLQPDGRIVAAGYGPAFQGTGFNPIVVRYNPDGSLDPSFSTDGISAAAHYNVVYAATIQPADGKIVVAGRNNANGGQFALSRFEGDGASLRAASVGSKPLSTSVHVPTARQLRIGVRAALARWSTVAASANQLAKLDVRSANLAGDELGRFDGSTSIGRDAAGRGWFVDPTPGPSKEFSRRGGVFKARRATRAFGRYHLLSAIDHQIGHALGLDHTRRGVMAGVLKTGERRLPGT